MITGNGGVEAGGGGDVPTCRYVTQGLKKEASYSWAEEAFGGKEVCNGSPKERVIICGGREEVERVPIGA